MDEQLGAARAQLDPDKPLVIFDVDEVLCPSMQQIMQRWEAAGYHLELSSPWFQRCTVIDAKGRQLSTEEIDTLVYDSYAKLVVQQPTYPEVPQILARLSQRANVMILTNLWADMADSRRANLQAQGMDYPMVFWQGSKAPAVATLSAGYACYFVDDNVGHISDVAESVPAVIGDHFIGFARLRRLAGVAPGARYASNSWQELDARLTQWLDGVCP